MHPKYVSVLSNTPWKYKDTNEFREEADLSRSREEGDDLAIRISNESVVDE